MDTFGPPSFASPLIFSIQSSNHPIIVNVTYQIHPVGMLRRVGTGREGKKKKRRRVRVSKSQTQLRLAPCALCSQCRKVMKSLEDDGLHTPGRIGNPEGENKERYFVVDVVAVGSWVGKNPIT